jgi:chaperonin cofactor prefoldin
MFNVELPPDSSWKWSTGITTEDQNEIQRLEKRIKVLEKQLAECKAALAEVKG